jgi:integrase
MVLRTPANKKRPAVELTAQSVAGLKQTGQPYRQMDTKERSFGVQVSSKGAKSYFVGYSFGGKRLFATLGSIAELTLANARLKAQDVKKQVREGSDPQANRVARVKAIVDNQREQEAKATVAELFADYVQSLRNKKQRSAESTKAFLNPIEQALGNSKAGDIQRHQVAAIIEAKAKTAGTSANRTHQATRAAFEFGISRDSIMEYQRYAITTNPAAFALVHKESARERNLSTIELRELWRTLPFSGMSDQVRGAIMLLLATGGCRVQEATNAKWAEFDFSERSELIGWAGIWNIPAGRTKNDMGNNIPLTTTAARIINSMRAITGESTFVFESPQAPNTPLAWRSINQALRRWSKQHGVELFQARDLRRTCETVLIDQLQGDENLLARLHGHALTRVDQKHYNRAKYNRPKLEILQRWSDWLDNKQNVSQLDQKRRLKRS